MNLKRILLVVLGVVLFLGGITLSLFISGNLLWGEMEARLYVQQSGEKGLSIQCPLVIAPWEVATIKTIITNTLTDKNTKPQVNAFISRGKDPRLVSNTLALAPLESQQLEWTADKSDLVYSRLILVNILQRQYIDLPSRQGACSIQVFSLLRLSGGQTLAWLVAVGILCSLLGGGLLMYLYYPFTDHMTQIVQVNTVFLCLALAGLLSALPRLWGLTLILDSAALLTLAAVFETLLYPKK